MVNFKRGSKPIDLCKLEKMNGVFMKNNVFKNYKFMLKTICKASASRVWLNIFFTVINDLFSIFYNVLFFAYFMDAVEKGKSISTISKVLIEIGRAHV